MPRWNPIPVHECRECKSENIIFDPLLHGHKCLDCGWFRPDQTYGRNFHRKRKGKKALCARFNKVMGKKK